MNDPASTYAALFDAVSAAEVVKTAAKTAALTLPQKVLLSAGAAGLAALGGYGLYRLLRRKDKKPQSQIAEHLSQAVEQPSQAEEAYIPETDYAYEEPNAGTYGFYPGMYLGYAPYGVDPGSGYAPYEGWY